MKKMNKEAFVILAVIPLLILLLISNNGNAFQQKKDPDKQIILDHADTMRTKGDFRTLIGNVQIRQGNKTLRANHALWDSRSGLVNLSGNVFLVEPDQTITARRISYFENTGNYECDGDVDFVRKDSIRIRCDFARFSELDQLLTLIDSVRIDNYSDGAIITGQRGKWFKETEIAIVEFDPVYKLPGKEKNELDTLVIKSKLITFEKMTNSALFTSDVELEIAEMLAVSDTLFHEPDSERTELTGAPMIWRDQDQLSGKKINLISEDNNIERIIIKGDAVILSEAHEMDERRNRLAGTDMIIKVIDDSSRHVHVQGDAEGEYHVWDEQDVYNGVNLSAADVIELIIEGNKVSEIILEGRTSGAFYPPGMAPEK
ncbi:MAG: hypothetical protein HN590_14930 [Calditrichaeota bacterium]|nr:hypothetical protein [Calditrichota bacterium]